MKWDLTTYLFSLKGYSQDAGAGFTLKFIKKYELAQNRKYSVFKTRFAFSEYIYAYTKFTLAFRLSLEFTLYNTQLYIF